MGSNVLTPTGFNSPVAATVSGGTDSQIRKNGGTWTTAINNFSPGDTLQVRTRTAASYDVQRSVTVTVGQTSDTWTVRTKDIGGNDSNTVMLLHFNDNTFSDSSSRNHTTNEKGNPSRVNSPAKFGSAIYFDGNDRLEVPNHNDWCFGSNPWTVDL